MGRDPGEPRGADVEAGETRERGADVEAGETREREAPGGDSEGVYLISREAFESRLPRTTPPRPRGPAEEEAR